jgi:hypothetical protein
MVSAGAWERLVRAYRDLCAESVRDFNAEPSDYELAELLRETIREVEGDD